MNGNSNVTLHTFKNISINISGNINVAMSEVVPDCLKLYAYIEKHCSVKVLYSEKSDIVCRLWYTVVSLIKDDLIFF